MNIKKYIPKCIKKVINNINYFIFTKSNKIKIYEDREIIDIIIKEKKSISRYGDGEFKWLLEKKQESFQKESKELTQRLKEVLKCNNKDVLICIPKAFNNVENYAEKSKVFWKNFIRWYGKDTINYLNKDYYYGDTNFTRWYLEYKDKTHMKEKIENIKKIWEKRDIVIIEGKDTKMGVGNDLFDNCNNLKRIIAPSINAFEKYEDILKEAKKLDKDSLVLIALGPTATILAYDLANIGYQAIDIGHVDIEYEWYLRKATNKIPIPGKYVNEAGGIKEKTEIVDEKYKKSIIVEI